MEPVLDEAMMIAVRRDAEKGNYHAVIVLCLVKIAKDLAWAADRLCGIEEAVQAMANVAEDKQNGE